MSTKYNPVAIRRCVRRVDLTPGLQQHFITKSFTRPEVQHHPVIDLQTGAVHCSCEHFQYRLAKLNPTVFSPEGDLCKHLVRAIATAIRLGQMPQQRGQHAVACIHCGEQGAQIEVVDDSGNAVIGRACEGCIEARTECFDDFDEYSCAPSDAEIDAQAAASLAAKPRAASNFTMSADERRAALQARINAGLVSVDDLF